MTSLKPLKRHMALRPLSHDHHDALLLCWKIRKGLDAGIDTERIKVYAAWMFSTHLEPHFKIEEELVFTVMPSGDPLIAKALEDHTELRGLFNETLSAPGSLAKIADQLEAHIRFEERVLFEQIQIAATPEQLLQIESAHQVAACDDWNDEFWSPTQN
jgi:hypothetical protein